MSGVLEHILTPLSDHYDKPGVFEIYVTTPGRVFVKSHDQSLVEYEDARLGRSGLYLIARTISNTYGLGFDKDKNPTISASLPGNHRFEFTMGGHVGSGVSVTVRAESQNRLSIETLLPFDCLDEIVSLIKDGVSLLVSGDTDTGKTTVLRSLLDILPDSVRVVVVEDTVEIDISRFPNGFSIEVNRNGFGFTWEDAIKHCLRSNPDRLIYGEMSTKNAYAAATAMSSGVSGFWTTIHASSIDEALGPKFAQYATYENKTVDPRQVRQSIDLAFHLINENGDRKVSDIFLPRRDRWLVKNGKEVK